MPRRDLTTSEVQAAIDDPYDGIMSLKEAAAHCRVTPPAVQDWVRRGLLAATVVQGRSWVIYSHVVAIEHATRTSTRGRPRTRGLTDPPLL